MWEYRCEPVRAVDGDTIEVVVDLGFKIMHHVSVRVKDIDTPEIRGGTPATKQAGFAARAFVEKWMHEVPGEWPLTIRTEKAAKSFERWVADVVRRDGQNLATVLVEEGHAVVV